MSRNRYKITFKSNVKKVIREIHTKSAQRMRILGKLLVSEMREKLTGPRTGRRYFINELRKWYVASAPGEYPAEKLGNLIKSMNFAVIKHANGVTLEVGSNVPYDIELETGERPFLRRGLLEHKEEMIETMRNPFFV